VEARKEKEEKAAKAAAKKAEKERKKAKKAAAKSGEGVGEGVEATEKGGKGSLPAEGTAVDEVSKGVEQTSLQTS
jgi:methionyl-tRNA synthetase